MKIHKKNLKRKKKVKNNDPGREKEVRGRTNCIVPVVIMKWKF